MGNLHVVISTNSIDNDVISTTTHVVISTTTGNLHVVISTTTAGYFIDNDTLININGINNNNINSTKDVHFCYSAV